MVVSGPGRRVARQHGSYPDSSAIQAACSPGATLCEVARVSRRLPMVVHKMTWQDSRCLTTSDPSSVLPSTPPQVLGCYSCSVRGCAR